MLRPDGDKTVRARVEFLLRSGDACWCPLIRLELWNGAGGDREKKILRDFERTLPELEINNDVWSLAYAISRQARSAGVTVHPSSTRIPISTSCLPDSGRPLTESEKISRRPYAI